jgi:hypothetical protein
VKGSSRSTSIGRLATNIALLIIVGANLLAADGPALTLRASGIGVGASTAPLTIELLRWSTDAERAPLHAALLAPPPAPPAPAAPAAGRGRGGRGGRGAAPPPSPEARLTAAVKAAPTCGFIWGDGPTGYSIKYAWRSSTPDGVERIVLVTDRRLGAHSPPWTAASSAPGEQDFTVVEMRIDPKGDGEGKTSLATRVVMDTAANTIAVDGYASAPIQLKVKR